MFQYFFLFPLVELSKMKARYTKVVPLKQLVNFLLQINLRASLCKLSTFGSLFVFSVDRGAVNCGAYLNFLYLVNAINLNNQHAELPG